MENIYTVASSSASTTYGNVMLAFKEALVSQFMPNQFTDVYISSEIAYINMRRRLGRNTRDEMKKLKKPYISIQPQIQPPNSDLYLFDIPLTKNIDNIEHGVMTNTLFPIIVNPEDGYSLKYKINRDQIQFDIRIRVETSIQQIDLYKYMLNYLRWDQPFSMVTALEAMIPREIVSHMSKLSNIWIDDKETNQIPSALRTMNQFSKFPITYKMRTGTSRDEFFMYYTPELIITLTDLSPEAGNMRNMISDYYEITFRATVDFNLPGMFILTGEKPKPDTLKVSMDVLNNNGHYDYIPLYTIHNLQAKYKDEEGFVLYTSSRFQTERDSKTKRDSFELGVLFEKEQLNVIREYIGNHVPVKTLFHIELLRDGVELKYGKEEDYFMDWGDMNIIINDADDKATYCLLIYINNGLFNEEITNRRDEKNSDKNKA